MEGVLRLGGGACSITQGSPTGTGVCEGVGARVLVLH